MGKRLKAPLGAVQVGHLARMVSESAFRNEYRRNEVCLIIPTAYSGGNFCLSFTLFVCPQCFDMGENSSDLVISERTLEWRHCQYLSGGRGETNTKGRPLTKDTLYVYRAFVEIDNLFGDR